MSQNPPFKLPNPERMGLALGRIREAARKLVAEVADKQARGEPLVPPDASTVARAFVDLSQKMAQAPGKVLEVQAAFWRDYTELWVRASRRVMGEQSPPVIEPAPGDRRFKDEAWAKSAVFDFVKQSYLLTARSVQQAVAGVEGLDPKTAAQVDFFTRQFIDALSPSNNVVLNPVVLRETLATGGENLMNGLANLLEDLERGKGDLRIRLTDARAFKVGENVAATPGRVILRNELMELIQYAPTTARVRRRPLLIVPPWINKYYVLDLTEKGSFVRWAVSEGITVFMISWVNPDAALANKGFEDYLARGPLAALEAIEAATGEREVASIGYCLGGTLLACALAYLAKKGDERLGPATLFTTMTDFSEPGELGVFIDEPQLQALEQQMEKKGFLDGGEMASAFSMLRANDLIWSFVVQNYLLGKEPLPFDVLAWGSDTTRMPARMHGEYLRSMYQRNLLREPGGVTLLGEPLDLRAVTVPVYFLSAREDYIAPWKTTYLGTQLFSGPVRFVLGGSGHIAGVVNPASSKKYGFSTGPLAETADAWLAGATEQPGSWWRDWLAWVTPMLGEEVLARTPALGIEEAPGTYVKVRI